VQLAPKEPDAVAMDLAGFASVYVRRALPGKYENDALFDALVFATQAAGAHCRTDLSPTPTDAPCPLGGQAPAVNGVGFPPFLDSATDRTALAELRQASRTTAGWYASNAMADYNQSVDLRIAAGAPAAKARLVTPLSSAVVLETRAQYEENGLTDSGHSKDKAKAADRRSDDPQVNAPEPAAGVLVGLGLLAGLSGARRRRCGCRYSKN